MILLIINFTLQLLRFFQGMVFSMKLIVCQTINHLARDWDYSFLLNKKETKDYNGWVMAF